MILQNKSKSFHLSTTHMSGGWNFANMTKTNLMQQNTTFWYNVSEVGLSTTKLHRTARETFIWTAKFEIIYSACLLVCLLLALPFQFTLLSIRKPVQIYFLSWNERMKLCSCINRKIKLDSYGWSEMTSGLCWEQQILGCFQTFRSFHFCDAQIEAECTAVHTKSKSMCTFHLPVHLIHHASTVLQNNVQGRQ